jgi:hypothetical protein
LSTIGKFIAWADAGDFAYLNLREPANAFKDKPALRTKHRTSGKPPIEFSLTEELVDLKIAYECKDLTTAIPLYYYLRNLIGDPPEPPRRRRRVRKPRTNTQEQRTFYP